MPARLAALLALALASGAQAEVGGAVSVGAGYDASASLSAAAGPLPDAAFTTAHAHLSIEAGPGSAIPEGWSAELAYDGQRYPDLAALDLDRPSLTLAMHWPLGERRALRLAATGAWRRRGQGVADGWEAGGAATLVQALGRGVRLKVGAGYRALGGTAALPGWTAHARTSLHLSPWRSATLSLLGGAALGAQQLLAETATPQVVLPSVREGVPLAAAAAEPVASAAGEPVMTPVAADLRTVMAGGELQQRLGGGLALSVGWLWSRTGGDLPASETQLGWLEVGWEW